MPGYRIAIGYDSPQLFLDRDMASLSKEGYVWTKREKAENVIVAGQARKMWNDNQKKSMRIIPEEEQVAEKTSNDVVDSDLSEDPSSVTEENDRLFDAILALGDIFSDYPHLRSILCKAVSREDVVTLDLLHYIELTSEDDGRQQDYARMLRECRVRRRKAKDMLAVVDLLETAEPAIRSAAEWIQKAGKRKYRARAVDPLPEVSDEASDMCVDTESNALSSIRNTEEYPSDGNDCVDLENDSSLDALISAEDASDFSSAESSDDPKIFFAEDSDEDASDDSTDVTDMDHEQSIAINAMNDDSDSLTSFSEEFSENYRATHKKRKDGEYGMLGEPEKVYKLAEMAETYRTAIVGADKPEEVLGKLGKNASEKKIYFQISRGTGNAGKVAKAWLQYRCQEE